MGDHAVDRPGDQVPGAQGPRLPPAEDDVVGVDLDRQSGPRGVVEPRDDQGRDRRRPGGGSKAGPARGPRRPPRGRCGAGTTRGAPGSRAPRAVRPLGDDPPGLEQEQPGSRSRSPPRGSGSRRAPGSTRAAGCGGSGRSGRGGRRGRATRPARRRAGAGAPRRERPGQADPLPLAAREGRRPIGRAGGRSRRGRRPRPVECRHGRPPGGLKPEADVRGTRPGAERAGRPGRSGRLRRDRSGRWTFRAVSVRTVPPRPTNPSAGPGQAGDQAEDRRLARARGAEEDAWLVAEPGIRPRSSSPGGPGATTGPGGRRSPSDPSRRQRFPGDDHRDHRRDRDPEREPAGLGGAVGGDGVVDRHRGGPGQPRGCRRRPSRSPRSRPGPGRTPGPPRPPAPARRAGPSPRGRPRPSALPSSRAASSMRRVDPLERPSGREQEHRQRRHPRGDRPPPTSGTRPRPPRWPPASGRPTLAGRGGGAGRSRGPSAASPGAGPGARRPAPLPGKRARARIKAVGIPTTHDQGRRQRRDPEREPERGEVAGHGRSVHAAGFGLPGGFVVGFGTRRKPRSRKIPWPTSERTNSANRRASRRGSRTGPPPRATG